MARWTTDFQGIGLYRCRCGLAASEPTGKETYDHPGYFHHWDGAYGASELADMSMVLDIMDRHAQGKRLLDVGTGSACLLSLARQRGYAVEGTDISAYTCQVVPQKTGITMHHGYLEELHLPANYDVVSLIHVLEHVNDPVSTLRKARALLTPAGILFLIVPNWRTPNVILKNWLSALGLAAKPYKHLSCFHHNWFFCLPTLLRLGEKTGLKTLHEATLCPPRKNGLYHQLVRRFDMDNWLCAVFR